MPELRQMKSTKTSMIQQTSSKSPTVYLAHISGCQGDNNLIGRNGVEQLKKDKRPSLLFSYYYLDKFIENIHKYAMREWMLDSGAFSVYNKGGTVDLNLYTDTCHRLIEAGPPYSPVEVIALDVIGDGEGSLKNAIKMRDSGLDVIPVFHIGEDWDILKEYAKGWDKVGLSCRFGEPVTRSMEFYGQCFARIWPKKCHSFGWVGEEMLMRFPFHSSDSADWEVKPVMFGTWRAFADKGSTNYLNWKGSSQNLLSEIEWYLNLEQRLRDRWKKEMQLLDNLPKKSTSKGKRG
jgi:hypothetical protein